MPRRLRALTIAVLMCLSTCVTFALERSPEWQDTLSKINALQADPLKSGAKEDATAIVKWLTETKEVSVSVCADLLVELANKDDAIAPTLTMHGLLGAAKYAMTIPTETQSRLEMYVASLDSALHAYEKLLAADQHNRRKPIDKLLEVRDSGKLRDYVQKHSKKCSQ